MTLQYISDLFNAKLKKFGHLDGVDNINRVPGGWLVSNHKGGLAFIPYSEEGKGYGGGE